MFVSWSGLLVILFLLIGISAFFSAAEIGMMSINRYRLRHLVREKKRGALRVIRLLERPDRLFGVLLTGSTLANILASMVATLLGERFGGTSGIAIATILLTFIILVVSEMVPKTVAAIYPEKIAFFASFFLKWLDRLFRPLVLMISGLTTLILKVFGISVSRAHHEALTSDELRSVVREAKSLLKDEHHSMLIGLLDLEEATVEDVMIPIADVTGIDIKKPWQDILFELETAKHTRLPLYYENFHEVLGVVHVRDVLNLMMEGELDLSSLMNVAAPPLYTLEGTSLNVQLLNFRREKKRSCFVVSEYGDLKGLVTLEDILEEVVGEFTTDISDVGNDFVWQADGSVIVDASLTLKQIERLLGLKFPVLGPKTLSGAIIEYLGYIPPADCCLRLNHYQVEIMKVSEHMIKMVRIKPQKA